MKPTKAQLQALLRVYNRGPISLAICTGINPCHIVNLDAQRATSAICKF